MSPLEIVLGNLCSVGAMITDSVSGTRNTRERIMLWQIGSQIFYGAGAFILKGYSAMVQNVVAVFRNFAAMKNVKSKVLEWMLVLAGVVFGVIFNNRGLLGYLPIVANFQYSVSIFRFKDNERALKISFFITSVMFSIFSVVISNYVGIVSNAVVAVTTLLSLIREGKKEEE